MKPEESEFFRNIRGRFQSSKSQRRGEWLVILFLGVFEPIFCSVAFYCQYPIALDKNHLVWILFALGGCVGGLQLFRCRALEYEFTGEDIIERRAGRVKNQIRISDIIETKVKISPHQLMLNTGKSKMTIQIVPALNDLIQRKGAEMMASKSESEQQHFEKVKQEMNLRLKRANVIGGIILTLIMFALAWLAVWLKQKHYLP